MASSASSRIASPASLSPIAIRPPLRRTPPPPPASRAHRPRQIRIPVTQFMIYESSAKENPFSDIHHLPSLSPPSSSLSFISLNTKDFNPTSSIHHVHTSLPAVQPISSGRVQELQNIPCTEQRCKLVAGRILNRGGKPMRFCRRTPLKCRDGYVPSSLSNVVVVAGDE